jgi:uroporphyrinogen-III decarboxylase
VVLEALRRLKRELGDKVAIGSWTLGPFTELGQVMDLEILLKMAAKKPEVVTRHAWHLTSIRATAVEWLPIQRASVGRQQCATGREVNS